MKRKTVKKILPIIFVFVLVVSALIIKVSFSLETDTLTSNTYEIKNNKVYAVPTAYDLTVSELITNLDYKNHVEVYNKNNEKKELTDNVNTGYKIKVDNTTYDLVVLGDVTGDGAINLGDVSKLYNFYKGKSPLSGNNKEAGKVTKNNSITIGDVSKLYNFYKGKSPLSYFDYTKTITSEDDVENLVQERVGEIRSTPNTDISARDQSKIFYVSNDGDDSNDGKSPEHAIKTLSKVVDMFNDKTIKDHSTILFRDGDRFYGLLPVKANDILIGSYGDISKGKPLLTRSPYNGAKEGTWVEVKPNIWKYKYEDNDQVFKYDVGMLSMFCKKGNNNCKYSMTTLDETYDYGQKITTKFNYDDSDLDSKIDTILTNDLEFYHAGHAYNAVQTGGALYLYSTSNPSTRFDTIEFSQAGNMISTYDTHKTNLYIDNIKVAYVGSSGVLNITISNIVVKNSEFAFIGGSVHNYDRDSGTTPTRYGNAITPVASIEDVGDYPVEDGFVVENNYVYQCYDTGLSFQYTGKETGRTHSRVEKAVFNNNVLEYSNYNIEYWTNTISEEETDIEESYINKFDITNNIMRYAGYGIAETRPDKGQSTHIKTWNHDRRAFNVIKDRFIVNNNIFDDAKEQFVYIKTGGNSLPTFTNNLFFGNGTTPFGVYSYGYLSKNPYAYDIDLLNEDFPHNKFVNLNPKTYSNASGTLNSVTWEFNASTNLLSINGSGEIPDFSSDNLPPWHQYNEAIKYIVVGENITKLGKYSFYDLKRVREIRINSINLVNLSEENYVLYLLGNESTYTTLIFGSNVEKIPAYLLRPSTSYDNSHSVNKIIFEGNKITEVTTNSLFAHKEEAIALPEGITKINLNAFASAGYERIVVMPMSATTYGDRTVSLSKRLEKVIFGDVTDKVPDYTFRQDPLLKEVVIPDVTDTSYAPATTFEDQTGTVTIYGNASTKTWLDNVKAASSQTNLVYKPLSEYRSNVTSNSDINETVGYKGSVTFTTNKTVKAYTYYIDSEYRKYKIEDIDVIKSGNTYTINNIRQDVYIELK